MAEITVFDFLESVRNRTTEQFKEKEVWDSYLQLMTAEIEQVQENIVKMLRARDIDVAVGVQLDIIGRIVGIPRLLASFELYEYFGFEGAIAAETFGSLSNEDGGFFRSLNSAVGGDYVLSDDAYRFFIKAQIVKNRTNSTPDELLDFMSFLFGEDTKIYYKGGGAKMTIFFGRELSDFEKNLLNFYVTNKGFSSRFIMKTLGVSLDFATFDQNRFFAFQGFPNARGFGTRNLSDSGFGRNFGSDWSTKFGSQSATGGILATQLRY